MKLLIIGGVAGGASAAARARRLSEESEIILFERGKNISFANCGMPYYIGREIKEEEKLLITSPELLRTRFKIDVRLQSEVLSVDKKAKTIVVKNWADGSEYIESYDKLIISTGAAPIVLPIEGSGLPGVFTLRNLDDMTKIDTAIDLGAKSAAIIGGGYIGLEMAENLRKRQLDVHVIEAIDQLMPPLDKEMASMINETLTENGIKLYFNSPAQKITKQNSVLVVHLPDGKDVCADMVIMCVGVKPDNKIAKEAGLNIGDRGAIIVDEHMKTSDADIYAVGDVCEVKTIPLSIPAVIPLASPANRQGRIAADNIFGKNSTYRGTQGTSIVGVFGISAAVTGLSEKVLTKNNVPFEKIYVHPNNHAGYYPGAQMMTIKLIFRKDNGEILGAQIVGQSGVDKRIDVFSMAIQAGMTVFDLEESELAYAPQFGSAKDPVNMAGFTASNLLRGDTAICHNNRIPQDDFLLDVRTEKEVQKGAIPGYYNIPIDELRERLGELPKNKKIAVYCQAGLRGYIASRILKQNGFDCENISGGYKMYKAFRK